MKLHCHRPSLVAALQAVSAVVPSRTPKEILKNVKLVVESGQVTLQATDQEVGIHQVIEGVETDSAGIALLPAARLLSILRELTDEAADIEVTQDSIRIRSGRSDFKLSAEDPAEYPAVPTAEGSDSFSIESVKLRKMVRRTAFATDVESTRYALGGLQMEVIGDDATLAATDSRRLAVVRSKTCDGSAPEGGKPPVIPTKAMSLLERNIPDDDTPTKITVRDNDVLFECGTTTIYSRLVEGRFPQYRDVIPAESRIEIELIVGMFYAAIRQAQIVTDEESRGVDFTFNDGTLTLNSTAADVGQSQIEVPIAYDGESLTITFDPRYIADFLKVLDQESSVTLKLTDGESAAVFTTGEDYTYVIMPLARDR
jgi:DNA polymerase-3 subunit beta